ncbi:MAG: tRNA guanosine(34) transglycosylase Tgt [Deltaproteobacteria bacterium]|jgi:queuine tRNA-ribosyltransferase|nr:tRNA guanosine(34) transglycosylase Tgt [Deltaproteobacteria bacterium]
MAESFGLELQAESGGARRGRLTTVHGRVQTPAFMPVATYGAVRGIGPDELAEAGAEILLANTYHLHERPGEETVEALGGLHGFTGWEGPWLTDSGGFQITSLSDRARIDEQGVTFTSTLDGRRRQLTPESAIRVQEALGADIAMVLDECIPLDDAADRRTDARRAERAMERTLRWAERSLAARSRPSQAVFAIVQGGASETLRRRSAEATAQLDFEGYAHGGLGLGESREERRAAVAIANEILPRERPRYLMGLGRPLDLLDGVAAGVDLFDCVVPTRNGRHGLLFTSRGLLNLRNARFERDPAPPDPECACPACGRHSRGYLRHLIRSGETLGARLAALHNLTYYMNLLRRVRRAISDGSFMALHREIEELAELRVRDD